MSILAVIPTKNRSTTLDKVISTIAPLVDYCLVVSSGSIINIELPDNVALLEGAYSLCEARNMGVDHCEKEDILFQIDDDIKFSPNVIKAMLRILEKEEKIAAVGCEAQLLAHWSEGLQTNKPFKMATTVSQLWAVRSAVANKIVRAFKERAFEFETMEDIRFCTKLWTLGYPIVKVYGKGMFHEHLVNRINKPEGVGGQTISERDHWLPIAIKHLQEFVGEKKVLRFCNLSEKKDGQLSYRLGYNYPVMSRNSIARNGELGYHDSRKHSF